MNVVAGWWLAIAAALGCVFSSRAAEPGHEARIVRDVTGREVCVTGAVKRIIALGPGALRLVAYLQDLDKVVGIEDMERRMDRSPWIRPYASALPQTLFNRPVVGPGGPGKLPDFERLIVARPDVVVTINTTPRDNAVIQARTGIPTVGLSYGELGSWGAELQESLALLGSLLGKEDRARQVNEYIRALEQDLARRTQDIPEELRPSAYFGGISFKGSQGFASTQAGYTPSRMIRACNVADSTGKSGHMIVDKEQILRWDPDVIFVDIGSRAVLEKAFVRDRSFYRLLKAVQTGRIYSLLPYNYYNTNIETALLNSYFIGKCLYPDRFADVEMQSKASEIFSALLGVRPSLPPPAYGAVVFPEAGGIEWGARTAEDP